jgi:hypothetical protein
MCPDTFTDKWTGGVIPLYIDWFDSNYYLLNLNKITLLDKDLNIKGATFLKYEYCNLSLNFYSIFKQKIVSNFCCPITNQFLNEKQV